MPSWPSTTNWPGSRNWPAGNAWPSSNNWPADFNGNFASLFSGVLQSVQTDLGLTYGGTMLDAGGIGPVITLTGTLSGPPVPIWVKATSNGSLGVWTYAIYYDGAGTTPAMTGTSAAAIPLTGAGAGLTVNIAAGTAVLNNIWKATCSALADQSGNGVNAAQATASSQPALTTGLNGCSGIAFDGVDDFLGFTLALPAPGTTPTFFWAVWRQLGTVATTSAFTGDTTGTSLLVYLPPVAVNPQTYNGTVANPNTGSLNTWVRAEALFSNSTSDYLKWGAAKVQGTNAGNGVGNVNRRIADANGGNRLSMELLAMVTLNNQPSAAQLAAASAAVASKYGGLVSV